jgi:hypothetical protein
VADPAGLDRLRGPRRRPGWLVAILGVAGFGALVYLVLELGPGRIAEQLRGLGSILPIVLTLAAMKYVLQTAGWRMLLPGQARPPWLESAGATVAGDALGYLTWAGPFTGEPVRAVLLRRSVPMAEGIAAGGIERAMYNATAGALVAAVLLTIGATAPGRARVLFATIVCGAVAAVMVRRWRRRRRGEGVAAGAPARPRAAWIDAFRAIWRERRAALPALAALCLAQHALLVIEAYVMLTALGAAPTLVTALVFESVTKIVNTAGLLVPARLGVSEGGSALLARELGFAASYGVSLALMRRVRALICAAAGLAFLPWQAARARRSRQPRAAGSDPTRRAAP